MSADRARNEHAAGRTDQDEAQTIMASNRLDWGYVIWSG